MAPDGPDSAEDGSRPEPDERDGLDLQAQAEAKRSLWPWVARRTRPQIIALVLISCLALGPIVALTFILRADPTPVNTLVEPAAGTPEDVTKITATLMGLSPSSGELRARISVVPSPELESGGGRLDQPVSVTVTGAQGFVTRDYLAGETVAPFDVTLPLNQGSTTRYPFDSYQGSLLTVVSTDAPDGGRASQPVALDARSVVADFDLTTTGNSNASAETKAAGQLEWEATRPATTTIYAIWLMVLMWGLAVTGLLLVWAVVIWMVELPFWCFGYFVGVLFALPPLRDSLPGRPPPGTIFDFGSFYWAITIIGVSLILMLSIWLRRTRDQQRLRALAETTEPLGTSTGPTAS